MVSFPSEPGPTRTVMASWWRVPLAPVHRRWVWLGWGLALQAAAVAIALELAYKTYENSNALGLLSRATVTLIVDQLRHNHRDEALLALVAVLFVAGSVALARPFVRRRATLVLAVPVAALAGIAVFGAVALVIAAVIAVAGDQGAGSTGGGFPVDWLSGGGGGSRRRRDRGDDDER
jgi:hypothetical protein